MARPTSSRSPRALGQGLVAVVPAGALAAGDLVIVGTGVSNGSGLAGGTGTTVTPTSDLTGSGPGLTTGSTRLVPGPPPPHPPPTPLGAPMRRDPHRPWPSAVAVGTSLVLLTACGGGARRTTEQEPVEEQLGLEQDGILQRQATRRTSSATA
jgi:hypothetical protein